MSPLADALFHPIYLTHPDWRWSFDAAPEQAQKDRQQLIELAASEQALVFGSHLPFPGVGRLICEEGSWCWQPIVD